MNTIIKNLVPVAFTVPLLANSDIKNINEVSSSPREKVSVQQNRLIKEFVLDDKKAEQLMSNWAGYNEEKQAVMAQSTVDSLGYRNLFDGTNLAKDSAAVEEFNKIAKNNLPDKKWGFPTYSNEMDRIMRGHGITQTQIYKFKGENQVGRETFSTGEVRFTARDTDVARARYQFQIDSVAYQRFFEKNNLINKDFQNKITNLSKKIKLKMIP